MKAIGILVFVVFTMASCAESPKKKTPEAGKKETNDTSGGGKSLPIDEGSVSAIVMLNQDSKDICMGAFVANDIIATAKHCVNRESVNLCTTTKVFLTKYDKESKIFKVTKTSLPCEKQIDSETLDLSFVKLKSADTKYQPSLTTFDDTVAVDELVEAAYPGTNAFIIAKGFISTISPTQLVSNIRNVQGMSGSPVFRRNTNLEGNVSAVGLHLKSNTGALSEALPAKQISDLYQNILSSGGFQ